MTDTLSQDISMPQENSGAMAIAIGAEGDVTPATPKEGFKISDDIIVLSNPNSIQAEAVGALRTHLLAQHIRDGRRSLAICAPAEGTGATYIAANLAASLAMAGVNTLLIDANMRHPAMENYFKPSSPREGLSQYLSDPDITPEELIEPEILPNLSVLYAGGKPSNAQELLAGRAFTSLVENCMRAYDVTIVDTPPSNISADARRIAVAVRYALIVARRNESFVTDIKTLLAELTADRAKVIGTLLNEF